MGSRNFIRTFSIATLLFFSSASAAEPKWLLELEESLESRLLVRLNAVQQGNPAAFTTDGCSGGLSEAWVFLGEALPKFAKNFGARPVWEDCCIAHDRAYWSGETADGFSKRIEADQALRGCVLAYGPRLAPELAARHGMSERTVKSLFNVAGEMMYQAVRAGGKPCTFLPWRWGYGWPQCPLFIEQ